MKRCLRICHFIALIQTLIIGAAFSNSYQIAAQRLSRPPGQEPEVAAPEKAAPEKAAPEKAAPESAEPNRRLTRAPILDLTESIVVPAGANSIPEGTKLIVELENRLSSKESRAGDRFIARLSSPVVDEDGRTLVLAGSIIEGTVVDAQPAKRRRRSGILQLTFDNLRLENDQLIPIRGKPTNAEDNDRNRFDDEGNVKSASTTKGSLKIAGASAGTGLAIGAAAGGALAGVGIGAVAGLTIALLMKGSDVVIEPGHLFALELIQPVRVSESPEDPPPARTILRPSITRNRPKADPSLSKENAIEENASDGIAVDVSDVRSERTPDGMLMILVTAKTPGPGWRIFADHAVSGDQVEVSLCGVPPPSAKAGRVSHPTAPTISIPDNDSAIKRVIVRAKNGVRETKVRAYPGSRPTATAERTTKPGRPASPASGSSGSTTSSTAPSSSLVVSEIEQLRTEFGTSVGVRISKNDAYEASGDRKPTADEKQLLDALGSQLNSVQAYIRNASTPSTRRNSALLIEEDVKLVEQVWMRIKMSADMNRRFRAMMQNTKALIANDLSESQPTPTPASPTAPTRPSTSTSSSTSQLATTVIGEITQCQYDFGATVGVWINPDGTSDLLGQRKPTADEQQILDGMAAMLVSAKAIERSSGAPADRNVAGKLRSDAARVEQAWRQVKMTIDLNQKFARMLQDSRALADMASR
jgi:hypothetical protein